MYQPSLSLLSDEPDLKALLGKDQNKMATNALRYVLSQDIAVTIPGMRSTGEVEVAAEVGREFKGLTQEENQSGSKLNLERNGAETADYALIAQKK